MNTEPQFARTQFGIDRGVRLYKRSPADAVRLLSSTGAPKRVIEKLVYSMGPFGIDKLSWGGDFYAAFDHPDIWGKNGSPTILVGHSYGSPSEHTPIYDTIRSYGFTVDLDGPSYYGHSTFRAMVTRNSVSELAMSTVILEELSFALSCSHTSTVQWVS